MDEKTYRIGEAATLLGLKTYVLRFWEVEFSQISPLRTEKGQRLYRESDIAVLRRIRYLLHERGLTIEGARRILAEEAAGGKKKGTPHGTDERDLLSLFPPEDAPDDAPDDAAEDALEDVPEDPSGDTLDETAEEEEFAFEESSLPPFLAVSRVPPVADDAPLPWQAPLPARGDTGQHEHPVSSPAESGPDAITEAVRVYRDLAAELESIRAMLMSPRPAQK